MAVWKIPLTQGAQTFQVTLGENLFTFTLIYRDVDQGGWFLDMVLTDGSDGIYGIPLVINTNLLEQHSYKGWGALVVNMDGGLVTRPNYEQMGENVLLYWDDEK